MQNLGLLKCPKSTVSEHLWTVNNLKVPKHCINLNDSIFVISFNQSETLRLFVNIFTPDDMYSLSVKAMFNATNSNATISKSENIFWFFFCIYGIYIKFEILWRKRWASEVICFRNYRLQNARLLQCIKSRVAEHLWTVNMLKYPKGCYNLHGSILSYFLISLKRNQLQKFYFSSISNLETVC